MQKNYDNIKDKGAEVIAISNDTVDEVKETVEDLRLTFTVLSDDDIEAISAYNVNDPEAPGVAVPSTFIIEPDGVIVWKSLDTVEERVATTRILTELGKLW